MAQVLDGLAALAEAQEQKKQEQDAGLEIKQTPWPDPLAEEAYRGLAGDIVRAIEPHTEANPAALLVQFLVAFGSAVGRNAYFEVEADRHYTNLFAVLVGATAKARKGTSWGHVRRLFETVAPDWAREHTATGLSSGERVIWAVRDPQIREKKDECVIEDPGVSDKRLLVYQTKFASTLRVLGRGGNTLSAILREAWDTGHLRNLVKNNPTKATGAHISIIGHITKGELVRHLDDTEAGNGFANRFLWLCVKRSKVLPEGGKIWEVNFDPLVKHLKQALDFARTARELRRDEEARELWAEVYESLSEGHPGLLGAVIARAEAQVTRLALIYTLLDCSPLIRREHLEAALAVWEYCGASAKFIFGDALGDPVAGQILEALREAPEGLTRTEISALFQRNIAGKRIANALEVLVGANIARCERAPGAGRPAERWFAVTWTFFVRLCSH